MKRAYARYTLSLILCTVLLGAMAVPAFAGKDADSSAMTEDNDTNDGNTPNNVADEGDNQHPSGKDRSVEHGKGGNQGRSTSDPDDDGRGPDRSNGGADKPDGPGGEDLADQDGNNGCGNDDDFEDDNEGWCGRKPTPQPVVNATQTPAPQAATTHSCTPGSSEGCKPTPAPAPAPAPATAPATTCTAGSSACSDHADDSCLAGTATCPTSTTAHTVVIPDRYQGERDDTDADVATGSLGGNGAVLGSSGEATSQTQVAGVTVERGEPIVAAGMAAPAATTGPAAAVSRVLAQTGVGVVTLALLGLVGLAAGGGMLRRGRRQR